MLSKIAVLNCARTISCKRHFSTQTLIDRLAYKNKAGDVVWAPGGKWTAAHLAALNLFPSPTDNIDTVLPISIDVAKSKFTSTGFETLYNWSVGTVKTDTGKLKADDADANSSLRSLYTKLKDLESDRSEVLTTLIVGAILDKVGFDTDDTMLRFDPEVLEDVTVGPYASETIIDFSVRSMLAKTVDVGFGFEYPVVKARKRDTWDISPQIGSQLLGLARSRKIITPDSTADIPIYIVEVRGKHFSFWKAIFTRDVIQASIEGRTPDKSTELFYHRPRKGMAAEAGYDFADFTERQKILDGLRSLIVHFK